MNQHELTFRASTYPRLKALMSMPEEQRQSEMYRLFTRAERQHMASYGRRRGGIGWVAKSARFRGKHFRTNAIEGSQ